MKGWEAGRGRRWSWWWGSGGHSFPEQGGRGKQDSPAPSDAAPPNPRWEIPVVPVGSGREKGRAEGPAAPRGSADKAPAAAFVPFSDGVCSNYPRPGRHMGGGGAHGAGAAALAGLPAPASRAPAPTTLSPSLTLGGLPIECPRPLSFTFGENGIRSLPVYWPKVKPKPKPPGIHPRPDLERFPGKGVKGAPQISGDGGPRTGPKGGSLVLHKAGCQGCR